MFCRFLPSRFFLPLLIFFGFAQPTQARSVTVEVEVQHLAGRLSQAELSALLAHPKLSIEAHYQPTKLIDGVTARRERVMPFGSKLFEISQITVLEGAQIMRQGKILRVTAEERHAAHASYRIHSLRLLVPITPGEGRPQPNLEVGLVDPLEPKGAHAIYAQNINPAFEIGLCVRYRWSDTTPDLPTPTICKKPY